MKTIPQRLETAVAQAVTAWGAASGYTVESVVPGGEPPVDGVAVAAQLRGGIDGAVVFVVPPGTVDAEALAGLAAMAAEQLGAAIGVPLTVAGTGEVSVGDVAAAGGEIVTAQIAGAGNPFPMHWLVEPVLVARIEDDPVASSGSPDVAPASFPDLGPAAAGQGALRDLSLLSEVEMEVTVELGKTRLTVRELLALVEGSIIDLDRPADSEVSVYVNGTLIARGDVVVVDDELGVRITEVVARP